MQVLRAAQGLATCFVSRARFPEEIEVLNRALNALSDRAASERASLQARLALPSLTAAELNDSWRKIEQATATAEQLADPSLLARVLAFRTVSHRQCGELEASLETGHRALRLLKKEALFERSVVLVQMALASLESGRLDEVDALLPDLEATARRMGFQAALWAHGLIRHSLKLMRGGDLRAFLAYAEQALRGPAQWVIVSLTYAASTRLYLGQVEEALEQLAAVIGDQTAADHFLTGTAEANLFAGMALAGRGDRARDLFPAVAPWLPAPGRRNTLGAWIALEASVAGLALVGDRQGCGALYPLALAYIRTGLVCGSLAVGPGSPQLAAAIAAGAAGYTDKAHEHFEIALRQARELPHRILQPTVLYWYGRALRDVTCRRSGSRPRDGRSRVDGLPRARDGPARQPRRTVSATVRRNNSG